MTEVNQTKERKTARKKAMKEWAHSARLELNRAVHGALKDCLTRHPEWNPPVHFTRSAAKRVVGNLLEQFQRAFAAKQLVKKITPLVKLWGDREALQRQVVEDPRGNTTMGTKQSEATKACRRDLQAILLNNPDLAYTTNPPKSHGMEQ